MKSFGRNIYFFSKEAFGNMPFLFWTLTFPLLLACFFYFAFSSFSNMTLEKIPVAVHKDSFAAYVFPEIDIFETTLVERNEEGLELLSNKTVDGYVDPTIEVTLSTSDGVNQTIIRSVVDQLLRVQESGESAQYIDFDAQYTKQYAQTTNPLVVYFHILLASVCFYSVFAATNLITTLQGNLSSFGSRIAISPTSKSQFLLSGFTVCMVLNILSNLLLIGFITFVFKFELFTQFTPSLFLLLLGNLCGTASGFLIGSAVKNEQGKNMIALLFNLILSAMAGMMGLAVKFFLDQYVPFTAQYNPIALITNTLYRINFLGDFSSFNRTSIVLVSYTILLLLLSSVYLRRSRYDSV